MRRLAIVLLASATTAAIVAPAATAALAATPLVSASAYASFSPDGDGYRDRLRIAYRLSASAVTSVRVYRDAQLVRTLRSPRTQAAGPHAVLWDGRTSSGQAAHAGRYRWVVSAARDGRSVVASGPVSLRRVPLPKDRWLGFYVPDAPREMSALAQLESLSRAGSSVSLYYQDTSENFTAAAARNAVAAGKTPLVTLELWDHTRGVDQPDFRLSAIADGKWDAYLRRYAGEARAFGSTVWLRPLHEMNGDWYPWCGTANGNSPADFVPAWRRIRRIFAEEGATNVKFVWCPSSDSVPNTAANSFAAYWPGDAYVDYIALDGYNYGTSASWSSWRSFAETFGDAYANVTALSPKPMFIAETGCTTSGGDKAEWVRAMFADVPVRFPRLQGVCWFNVDKECDWRVESSASSLSAFTAGASAF